MRVRLIDFAHSRVRPPGDAAGGRRAEIRNGVLFGLLNLTRLLNDIAVADAAAAAAPAVAPSAPVAPEQAAHVSGPSLQ